MRPWALSDASSTSRASVDPESGAGTGAAGRRAALATIRMDTATSAMQAQARIVKTIIQYQMLMPPIASPRVRDASYGIQLLNESRAAKRLGFLLGPRPAAAPAPAAGNVVSNRYCTRLG